MTPLVYSSPSFVYPFLGGSTRMCIGNVFQPGLAAAFLVAERVHERVLFLFMSACSVPFI